MFLTRPATATVLLSLTLPLAVAQTQTPNPSWPLTPSCNASPSDTPFSNYCCAGTLVLPLPTGSPQGSYTATTSSVSSATALADPVGKNVKRQTFSATEPQGIGIGRTHTVAVLPGTELANGVTCFGTVFVVATGTGSGTESSTASATAGGSGGGGASDATTTTAATITTTSAGAGAGTSTTPSDSSSSSGSSPGSASDATSTSSTTGPAGVSSTGGAAAAFALPRAYGSRDGERRLGLGSWSLSWGLGVLLALVGV